MFFVCRARCSSRRARWSRGWGRSATTTGRSAVLRWPFLYVCIFSFFSFLHFWILRTKRMSLSCYWSLWPRYTINYSWYKFAKYSCYFLADEYYEWSLAAECLRQAIEMKSSWRNSTAVHQSLLSLKKRPPIYLFYVAKIAQNHVFFLGSGLRARGGFRKYNPRIFPHSTAAPLWVGRKNLLVAGS